MSANTDLLLTRNDNDLTIIALELKNISQRLDGHGNKIDAQNKSIDELKKEHAKTREELLTKTFETKIYTSEENFKTRFKLVSLITAISSGVSWVISYFKH